MEKKTYNIHITKYTIENIAFTTRNRTKAKRAEPYYNLYPPYDFVTSERTSEMNSALKRMIFPLRFFTYKDTFIMTTVA